jgi:hypothetical protein
MAAMSAVGFSGVNFHLRTCPQGVASVLGKKIPVFWVQTIKVSLPDSISCTRSELDRFSPIHP